ncbi:MAG: LPS export ABC transporter permease LptG [Desulfobacterales bacterium]
MPVKIPADMSILGKYLTKEILKYFGIILLMVVGIYLAVDFFEKVDNFLEAGLPAVKIVTFFHLRIPLILSQIAPVCILLAVLIVFGLMSKNYELIALRSSGISVYYVLKPVLSLAVVMSILLFLLADRVVPVTVSQANRIWLGEVKKEPAVTSRKKNIWVKGKRSISHIRYYNPTNQTISRITRYYFDPDFRLIRRLDAKTAYYENGKWDFRDIMEQRLNEATRDYSIVFEAQRFEPFEFLPDDLKRVVKKSEEMNFMELLEYIRDVESEGYDATNYRVELHAKLAFPVVCVIMCVLATGIAFRRKVQEGLALNIIFGIGLIFIYWIFYTFCLSLGSGGKLHPFIAAWLANFTFLCIGIYIFVNAD